MIRIILARIFRILFRISFFKKRFFGLYKRIFYPFDLFKGVVMKVKIHNDINLMLHVDDWLQQQLYFFGEYEKAELKMLEKFLMSDSVFIDIGANLGLYSLYASSLMGENGTVVCFEPFSTNYRLLKQNISLNSNLNIRAENMAIGETDGLINLYYDEKDRNLGMVSSDMTEYTHSEAVKAVSLDSYLNGKSFEKIDFIKIDIEGHEYAALLGMKNTLARFHPTLLIEILEEDKPKSNSNKKKIIDFLESFGYRKYFIDDDGSLSETEKNPKRMNYIFTKR